MDALTDANDVTNGNSPQRAVIADSVVTVDSGDAQTNCSSTLGPCHLKWKTSQGQTAALGATNGETSTPSDLAKLRLDQPFPGRTDQMKPQVWHHLKCVTKKPLVLALP
jgi:hypothetical protein